MFRKLFNKTHLVTKVIQRNSSAYDCYSPVPVIPACYWSVLPNGVKVISEQTCSDLASVSVLIEAGPKFEVPCNNGISYLIERVAYQGFRSMTKCDLETKIKCIGARLHCTTTREHQIFTAVCPPSCIGDIVDILYKIFVDLHLERSVECAKDEICEELIDVENDPRKLCFDYLHSCAFQGTSMGLPVIGPSNNYNSFNSVFVSEYIRMNYASNRIVLSLSGACTHNCFLCMVKNTFGCLDNFQCVPPPPPPARFTGSQVIFRHDGLPFSHNIIAVEAPGMASNHYLQFRVLTEVLGSWDKSQGTEYRSWPEAAQYAAMGDLCESYEAFYIPYKDVGLFGVYFVAENGKSLDDMVYNIQNQLMNMCNNLSKADTRRAAKRAMVKLSKEVEGCINSSYDQAVQVKNFGLRKNLCAQLEALHFVDNNMLQGLANHYIYEKCVACASVGPTESIPDYNRIRSGMYWLRI